MNIQIIGTDICFDTQKAERYFKERNVDVQFRDLGQGRCDVQSVVVDVEDAVRTGADHLPVKRQDLSLVHHR